MTGWLAAGWLVDWLLLRLNWFAYSVGVSDEQACSLRPLAGDLLLILTLSV